MKVAATSDWRDDIGFETPMLVAELSPGEPARCSVCGSASPLRPRTELWAIKHRHPKHHAGHVRFYCAAHVPAVKRPDPPSVALRERSPARAERRPAARRSTAADDKPKSICPDCFVEIPPTGVCGMCGRPAD